ncbi:replication regulator [Schizosaccharomyces japonicus yFS275]|uniref:Replication regulator n=2 Tax=Schizosaccharomyces japonicus TaxID=4897 RepID=B6JZS6_SCHJY|nr:replication regulator [Schizosaccharomyces japonicus yFS275]AFM85243.1 hypothetical protein [Schizosaccharomyces japonicus]EEB06076.1 replication regulator [Schizosaccharomyces japonicus yFS275]
MTEVSVTKEQNKQGSRSKRKGENVDKFSRKKFRKNKKEQLRQPKKPSEKTLELAVVQDCRYLDVEIALDVVTKLIKDANPDISYIELHDKLPAKKSFLDLSNSSTLPKVNDYEKLIGSLKKDSTKDSFKSSIKGAPQYIIVCSAALRVTAIIQALKKYRSKDYDLVKLFSRHFSYEDHRKALESATVGIAVGTPNRVLTLLKNNDLKLDNLDCLVLDESFLDKKQQSLLTLKQSTPDVAEMLQLPQMLERFKNESSRLLLF